MKMDITTTTKPEPEQPSQAGDPIVAVPGDTSTQSRPDLVRSLARDARFQHRPKDPSRAGRPNAARIAQEVGLNVSRVRKILIRAGLLLRSQRPRKRSARAVRLANSGARRQILRLARDPRYQHDDPAAKRPHVAAIAEEVGISTARTREILLAEGLLPKDAPRPRFGKKSDLAALVKRLASDPMFQVKAGAGFDIAAIAKQANINSSRARQILISVGLLPKDAPRARDLAEETLRERVHALAQKPEYLIAWEYYGGRPNIAAIAREVGATTNRVARILKASPAPPPAVEDLRAKVRALAARPENRRGTPPRINLSKLAQAMGLPRGRVTALLREVHAEDEQNPPAAPAPAYHRPEVQEPMTVKATDLWDQPPHVRQYLAELAVVALRERGIDSRQAPLPLHREPPQAYPRHLAEADRLFAALACALPGELLFVAVDAQVRTNLLQQLERRGLARPFRTLTLPGGTGLHELPALLQAVAEPDRLLFVEGIDHLGEDAAREPGGALEQFTLAREALIAVPAPLVFLMSHAAIDQVRAHAINLWSVRSYDFILPEGPVGTLEAAVTEAG